MPATVIAHSNFNSSEADGTPIYMVPKFLNQTEENLEHFLPKSECNFDNSSIIASKKVKYFAYDCAEPVNKWLLISVPEANYYDVLR